MKVLLADVLPPSCVDDLQALGCTVVNEPKLDDGTLPGAIGDAEVLVVRSTKVKEAAFEAGKDLALVIRAGAGVNNIDLEAASSRGVFVANCPGRNAVAVAELALGLLLAIDRRIADNVGEARAGKWNKKAFSKADGLLGKRMGIIGFGNIGRATAERAKAFGMDVVAWSRSLTDEAAADAEVERAPDVDALLTGCDVVSLHLAVTPDTKNILDSRRIGLLRPGCIVINTARAELVDEEALLAAAAEGKIRVGLDVMSDEPSYKDGDFEHPAATTPNVILTHHIGASTTQAQTAIANEAVRIVGHYVETGGVLNPVNLRQRTQAKAMLVVRHVDKVGVLAGVLEELRQAGLNVQEMENKLFSGGHPSAAVARIQLATMPTPKTLDAIRGHGDEIIHVQAFDIPPDAAS